MIRRSTIINAVIIGTTCFGATALPAFAVDTLGAGNLISSANHLEKQASNAAQVQGMQLEDVIKHADTMISTRIYSLNIILMRIQNDTRLTTDEKTSLTSSIQNTITGLNTLKTKIDADTDIATARADAKQIVTNYYVFAGFEPKTRLLITLNNMQTMVKNLQALMPQVQTIVTTLQSQGKDVSQITPLLTDLNNQLQTISTTLTNDITTVQNTSPSTTTKTSFTQVKQDIQTIVKTDFAKIRQDISQLRDLIKQLILPGKISPTVTGVKNATPTAPVTPTPTSNPTPTQ